VVLLYSFPASSFMFRDLIPCWPDRTRQRLELGQSVVPHGVDRDVTTGEVAPGRKP